MNKVFFIGRLTGDPEVRYGGNDNQTAIARFSLAVDRKRRSEDGSNQADFFNCTAFGRLGEFVEGFLRKGTKILLCGRVENNNYTDRNGNKVYATAIIAEEIEFAGAKTEQQTQTPDASGFVTVPDGVDDEQLPFA